MGRKNRRGEDSAPLRPLGSVQASQSHPDGEWHVRTITGAAATKAYRCPGCDHEVRAGMWHLVVVPVGDVDARRHWHTECWRNELRRLGLYRPPASEE